MFHTDTFVTKNTDSSGCCSRSSLLLKGSATLSSCREIDIIGSDMYALPL